ncbi:putative regulator of Ras-like GTPase activity (Roadblock/LC7/MglB family) [Streptomyces sp. LBL]|uniref:roadblock/LC7 domain-containing protein n=1 Tax=Streptomyces sp. LBL TaxID=2940562 RepID=UPI002474A991|nr:roadblock/LC7 domain-containing protein [Streptomyces sp. LBL]MDH6628034.1 putative regulator of Ras-like GTPase activity (Roadblock/LC7/MglB family) [Streptomyces sp. LBL]
MAAAPEVLEEVLEELRRLRARVPQLTGALAVGLDGLVLAQDTPGIDPESVAALTTTARDLAVQLAEAAGHGDFRELLVRGGHGYVATYAAGPAAVLTLLAPDRVPVGRLHLEGRRAGARIGELVEARAPAPAKAPAKQPRSAAKAGPARARTARTPRATTTNPRTTTRTTTES